MVSWLYENLIRLVQGTIRFRRLRVLLLRNPQSILGFTSQLAASVAIFLLIAGPVYALSNTKSATFASASSQSATLTTISGAPSGSGARSVSFWFKAVTTATQCVFQEGSSSGSVQQFAVCVNINGAGTHDFAILLNGGNVHYTASTIDNGSWHNLLFTYSGGGAIATDGKAYMDGSVLTQSSTVAATPNTLATCYAIGGNDQTGTCSMGTFANAKVDDVRVWSRALSSAEASSLFSSPCTFSNGASLDAWWQLEGNFNDSQSTNNLTANNAPTFTTDVAYTCGATASFNFSNYFPDY